MKSLAHWIGEGVGMIDTGGYGVEHAVASYVVAGEREAALVDVGYSSTWERTKEGLAELGVAREEVGYVFLTHVHMDHAGAAWGAIQDLPNARLVVHEKGIRHLIDPSRMVGATRAAFADQARHVGDMRSIQPERIEPAREERYDLGGRSLEPVFTAGHMPGHMSLTSGDFAFTGDAVCVRQEGLGLIPAGSPPIYDVPSAVRSVQRLEEAEPKVILAPHFGRYPGQRDELESHLDAMQAWREAISAKVDEGLSLQQITASMRGSLLERSGKKRSDLDDFTNNVLLDRLLTMTVEGYMGYLLAGKN